MDSKVLLLSDLRVSLASINKVRCSDRWPL